MPPPIGVAIAQTIRASGSVSVLPGSSLCILAFAFAFALASFLSFAGSFLPAFGQLALGCSLASTLRLSFALLVATMATFALSRIGELLVGRAAIRP